ncbi:MAG: hypothetical protein Fur0018_27250 [Anaerolineales bacterium]
MILTRRIWQVVSVLLLVALMTVTLGPKPAYAASTCVKHYTVQNGDSTPKIAHLFGLKWKEIRIANKLDVNYRPQAGDVLCIPAAGSVNTTGKTSTVVVFKASSTGHGVTITLSDLDNKGVFVVKVRDVTYGAGAWHKLGRFKVPRHSQKTSTYILPDKLYGAIYLQVCLKNVTTDESICRTVRHYP